MSINKENTNINKTPIVIVKEDTKLDYIVYIITKSSSNKTSVREMETIISNFIDYTCEQKLLEAEKCRILIKEKQPENYDKIIYAANGLIYNYDLVILVNESFY
jgi:hypothetical protein